MKREFPCILKGSYIWLAFDKSNATTLDIDHGTNRGNINFADGAFKNITPEYLANTYGEVKSKEHAEFIVKLAEVNGFDIVKPRKENLVWFSFWDNNLGFFEYEMSASQGGCKQITIPLPPESNVNTPEEDFEMTQVAKNNGDNLIFGGADKCKEWPCVNDEVETSDGVGVVKLMQDVRGYYVVSINGEYYQYLIDELSKPKTPEEELRELLSLLWKENNHDFDMFLDVVTCHVTKKPQ